MLGKNLHLPHPSNFITIIHLFDNIHFSDSVFKLQMNMQRKQFEFHIIGVEIERELLEF